MSHPDDCGHGYIAGCPTCLEFDGWTPPVKAREKEATIARLERELAEEKAKSDRIFEVLSAKERGLDEATEWIGVVRDELVRAGYVGGDRSVALGNLRTLIQQRNDAEKERDGARSINLRSLQGIGDRVRAESWARRWKAEAKRLRADGNHWWFEQCRKLTAWSRGLEKERDELRAHLDDSDRCLQRAFEWAGTKNVEVASLRAALERADKMLGKVQSLMGDMDQGTRGHPNDEWRIPWTRHAVEVFSEVASTRAALSAPAKERLHSNSTCPHPLCSKCAPEMYPPAKAEELKHPDYDGTDEMP